MGRQSWTVSYIGDPAIGSEPEITRFTRLPWPARRIEAIGRRKPPLNTSGASTVETRRRSLFFGNRHALALRRQESPSITLLFLVNYLLRSAKCAVSEYHTSCVCVPREFSQIPGQQGGCVAIRQDYDRGTQRSAGRRVAGYDPYRRR